MESTFISMVEQHQLGKFAFDFDEPMMSPICISVLRSKLALRARRRVTPGLVVPFTTAERGAVAAIRQAAVADFGPIVEDEHGDGLPASAALTGLGCLFGSHRPSVDVANVSGNCHPDSHSSTRGGRNRPVPAGQGPVPARRHWQRRRVRGDRRGRIGVRARRP